MLLAFSGLKGSGKDTAAAVLTGEYGFTKISFADPIREMALIINPVIPIVEKFTNPDQSFSTCTRLTRLKELIEEYGWDYCKRQIPEVRRTLQVIGTEAGRDFFNEDIWIELMDYKYKDLAWDDTRYVITDCRFSNEVEFIRSKGGTIIWIERPGLVSDGHASESTDTRDLASIIMHNDESVEELQEAVRLMLHIRGVGPIERAVAEQTN